MACRIVYNNLGGIDHVLAANGQRSILFDDIRRAFQKHPRIHGISTSLYNTALDILNYNMEQGKGFEAGYKRAVEYIKTNYGEDLDEEAFRKELIEKMSLRALTPEEFIKRINSVHDKYLEGVDAPRFGDSKTYRLYEYRLVLQSTSLPKEELLDALKKTKLSYYDRQWVADKINAGESGGYRYILREIKRPTKKDDFTIEYLKELHEEALAEYGKRLTPEYLSTYNGPFDANGEPLYSVPKFDLSSLEEDIRSEKFVYDSIVPEREALGNIEARVEARQSFEKLADKLSKRFGLSYAIVDRQEALKILNARGVRFAGNSVPRGFVMGGQVYLVKDLFTANTTIEEFLHPFTNAVFEDNQELFDSLYAQALENEGSIVNSVNSRYTDELGFTEQDRKLEIVTKVLTKYYRKNLNDVEDNSFLGLIRRAIEAIKQFILRLVNVEYDDVSVLPSDLTYNQLAKLIDSNLLDFNLMDLGNRILETDKGVQFSLGDTQLGKIKDDILLPIRERINEINRLLLTSEDEQLKDMLRQERSQLNQLSETITHGLTTQDVRFVTMVSYVNKLMTGYAKNVQEIYNSNESIHDKAAKITAAETVGTSIKKLLDNIRGVIAENKGYIQGQGMNYDAQIEEAIKNATEALDRIQTFNRLIGKQSTLDIIRSSLPEHILLKLKQERVEAIDREIERLRNNNKTFLKAIGNFITDGKAKITGAATAAELREKQIAELEALKAGFPENAEMVLDLLNPDSNSGQWMGKYTTFVTRFMPAKSSQDPIIYAFKKWMDEAQLTANTNTINTLQRSKINSIIDKKKQSGITGSLDIHQNIVKESEVLMWDGKEKKYVLKTVKHLLRPWSYDYDNKIMEWRNKQAELEARRDSAKTDLERDAATRDLENLKEERSDWYAEHVQEKYLPVYRQALDALPKEIRAFVEAHNARKQRIRELIEHNYRKGIVDLTLQEELRDIDIEMKNARSYIDENGNMKQGQALQMADTLRDFYAQIREFFDYEPDHRGYREMLEQFQRDVNAQTDPVMKDEAQRRLDKFIEDNFVTKIEDSWYEALNDLLDKINTRMSDLYGEDPRVTAAWEKYREIRRIAVDRNGDFDPTALTKEQRDAIEKFIEIIDEFENPEVEDPELKAMFTRLKALKKTELSKYYLEEFQTMEETLNQAYLKYKFSGTEADYIAFQNAERVFEKWYNKNHYDEYTSLETREANNVKLPQKVKRYWKKMVPVDTVKYTRQEPGNLFTSAKLKDKYIDPNYQEDSTGLPLPKAIRDNGDGTYTIVDPTSPYVDKSYINLSDLDKEHLVELKNLLYQAQTGTSRKKYGHILPALYAKTGEQLLTKGAKGTIQSILTDFNEGFNSEEAGRNFNNYVQLLNNTPIESKDQSIDATEAITTFYYNADMNKQLSVKRAQYEAAMLYLRNQMANLPTDRKDMYNDFKRAIGIIEGEGRKIIYGNLMDGDSKGARWLDGLVRYTGRLRTFANFIMHTTNYLSGLVQNVILSADPDLGEKNVAWGYGYFQYNVVPQLLRYEGRFNDASKDVQIFRWFNLTEDGIQRTAAQMTVGRLARIQNRGGINFMKEGGEIVIEGSLLFAALKAKKVFNSSGHAVSLLEAIEVGDDGFILDEQGNVRIKAGYQFTQHDLNEFRLALISKLIKSQGNYSRINATDISRHALGRFFELFRKYLFPLAIERVGARKLSFAEQEEQEGFYRTFFKSLYNNGIPTTVYGMFANNPKLTKMENENLKKTRNELIVSSALFALGVLISNAYEDEPEEERNILMGHLALILLRTSNEARSFSPFPLVGGLSQGINVLENISVAAGTVRSGYQLLEATVALPLALLAPEWEFVNTRAFYQSDSDYFDAGTWKGLKPLFSLSGIGNIRDLWYPKAKIEYVLNPR